MTTIRILLVADDPLARAGLSNFLADPGIDGSGIEIVMQLASDDPGLGEATARYRPDVILWDLGWEPSSNLDRLSDFLEIGEPVVVLLPTLDMARSAWAAGARALMARDADTGQILAALSAAAQGLVVVDPEMAAVLPLERAVYESERILEELTPREFEVLQLLAEGASNKAIARRLAISEHTVKYHVNTILGKLGAQSRTEAVVRATRAGLILL